MSIDFSPVEGVITGWLQRGLPAAQIAVRQRGQLIYQQAFGVLDPDHAARPVQLDTQFDMASVTKLYVTTAFMTLVESGQVALDQPVCSVLPQFSGPRPIQPYEDPLKPGAMVDVSGAAAGQVDAASITFRHLLSHTSGLPAWRPFEYEPSAEAARQMALETFFSYPTGQRVVYSDVGLILVGMSIEVLTGQALDEVVAQRVIAPLGMAHSGFRRVMPTPPEPASLNIAPTEFCAWRQRRICGEVHDENCYRLGGVSGHAGMFSTAADAALLGQMYLDHGGTLLKPATVNEMRRLQAEYNGVRRGIGFALWSPDPESASHLFDPSTFGHTGFTGTELWIDPARELVVAFLTNEVYLGRQNRIIFPVRRDVHAALLAVLDAHAKSLA